MPYSDSERNAAICSSVGTYKGSSRSLENEGIRVNRHDETPCSHIIETGQSHQTDRV